MSDYIIWICLVVVGFFLGWIFGENSPFTKKAGMLVIEKSEDKSENDKIRIVFTAELEDLYSAKLIKMSVVRLEKEKNKNNNSDNDNT